MDYALRLSLSVQQDQYYGSLRDSSGFKVMVHDQEEPPLINELGFAIQPGTHTFCGLRKEVVIMIMIMIMIILKGLKNKHQLKIFFLKIAAPLQKKDYFADFNLALVMYKSERFLVCLVM